ncbi:glycosyltransferase [Phreatobacter oligotrophus]|uniref:Glycosyltransferase involved in cell wall biosynthesis n=1 Tax=Phreatobacter oligotrophus TaxID=1122261 RepID=A0A2T4Z2N5_9HYPH|nr:glycosyltransferase [Phreatobacter oligotrophus]PTM55013.1 glycosyltransferase involved in cell wall biosynthesis [Phreatobacter oligotrophus]
MAGARPTVRIVAWDGSHNAFGRAHTLADIAARFATPSLVAPLFGIGGPGLWPPLAGQVGHPLRLLPGRPLAPFLAGLARDVADAGPVDVVHVSKPRLPSLLLGMMTALAHGARLIIDVDDDELAFVGGNEPLTWDEAVAESGVHAGASWPHDRVWTCFAPTLVPLADAVTVANVALLERLGGTLIRHARDETRQPPDLAQRLATRRGLGLRGDDVVLAFVGTPRAHKGLGDVVAALDRAGDPRLVLVVAGDIRDAATATALRARRGRVQLLPDQPFSRVADLVAMADAVPLLQRPEFRVSVAQIPAKLTDAMAARVPVLATEVPPLRDIHAAGALVPVTGEGALDAALAKLLGDRQAFAGTVQRAGELFAREFSLAANADCLAAVYRGPIHADRRQAMREVLLRIHRHAGVAPPGWLGR